MKHWKEVKLGDICDIIMGQSPKSEFYNNENKGIEFLQGNKTFGIKYPIYDTYTTQITKKALKNDIIMSVRAPVGDINITTKDICIGRGLCSLRMKNNQQEFLYYLLKNYSKELQSNQNGTVFGSINKNQILNFKVLITTNIEEQKAIAKTLSCLDEKIELNNKINKNLEEMAQAIFKKWFIDFDYPLTEEEIANGGREFVDSELGKIPKGWSVVELGNICNIQNGYSYKSDELLKSNIALVTIKNFERKGGFKIDGFKEIVPIKNVKQNQYVNLYDIIVAHTDLTQNADIIGNAEMILNKSKYENMIISMDIVKITSEYLGKFILLNILKNKDFKNHALGYVNGTTVLHLSKKAIPEYKIALPNSKKLLNKLDNILQNKYLKIVNNTIENEKLTQIRDTLLPKLINGDIRVNTVKI